ncbi:sn-glycerol-3-phosphate import ATP-binding protein UgpC [Rubellimicrobium rubrum]|uniref:sn-glycerol-3-phosphate import ATP-binding protein UgpC n=1 Tax=Rubellimicrobium rubrum TaxID=2585369 RepID=A0A5C4MUY7_9RHOB|nr:sn-glycerol-3-phosphate import ATP-binding protein UgpC [Rubellimicrobium rubrum]TNC49180.1 sn-glycerol-3-phosphate import ATP-binding protein UgpC [Rubellimicrobium rubrum]
MASITLDRVGKTYFGGTPAVTDISIDIADGEFLVLVGPSGCGKSTLLRMVAGLETVTSGTIRIGDRVVNDIEPADRDIAMVFQNYALYPHMSVRQNLAYGLTNRKMPKAEIARRVAAAAEILEIGPFLDRKPRALSGGQRQRVAMGRAIVREPAVFLFDEPLSNLDAKLRGSMRGEIRHLQQRLGTTSIYVTHDQMEAMTLADRLVVLNGGRIEQIGAPLEVYRRPASTFVAAFIGAPAMNLLAAQQDGGDLRVGGARLSSPVGGSGQVTVGIRPEDFVRADGTAANALSVRVDYVEELGATRLVHGRIDGQPLVSNWPAGEDVPDVVRLSVPPAAVHLFSPGTGLRLN